MITTVKSRQRIIDHGEVFTAPGLVNDMLDLVGHECERIDARFLEPACGDGNFLAEVLRRKLTIVRKRHARSAGELERYIILAVSSLYGIDILEDNVSHCRERLLSIVNEHTDTLFRDQFLEAVRFILWCNITWGDALSLKTVGSNPQPIIFSEWSPLNGSMIKRRDFTFQELLSFAGTKETPLFSDLGDKVFFPEPVREFPPCHYLKVSDMEAPIERP